MKKQLFGLMTILTILNACQKNEVSVSLPEEVTIHATIEDKDATKTIMDESNNILWSKNDQIIAFMKSSYGHKYQVKPSFVGKSYADFSMVSSGNNSDLSVGNELEHNVIYYPYTEDIECLKSGANYELEVNLPAEQTYVPDSFANGSMAMVAVSENNTITFKNVLGGIKLQLKGTQKVTSIKVEGKNNERLSGSAIVTAYTNDNTPNITVSSDGKTSVILNCGAGVQLNEDKVTEFIISLPPVLFSKGFVVTIFENDGNATTLETDKVNAIIRSSLLTMPIKNLNGSDNEEENEEELIVPVTNISLNTTLLNLYIGDVAHLNATVKPNDATQKNIVWSSDNSTVVNVDQAGWVKGLAVGTANISAIAGGAISTCVINVLEPVDYIDEYEINHGKGVAIGTTIWAPVNCGYHATDYQWGKLYQWGRKYGQGYSGYIYNIDQEEPIGTVSDATVPENSEGGVSEIGGNHKSNSNIFYTGSLDWVYPRNDDLWNSGTETSPVKTESDPCPKGWRVPTYAELNELQQHYSSWATNETGQIGLWFSGAFSYTEDVNKIFLPAAGYRNYSNGTGLRNSSGFYWSSKSYYYSYRDEIEAGYLFLKNTRFTGADLIDMGYDPRSMGYSVRCVLE